MLSEKYWDKLPQSTLNKLKKSMYRAVDLIEMFFPDPKDPSKRIVLGPYQKDFIDIIQFGYPLSKFKYGEIIETPKGVIYITRRQVGKSICCGYTSAALMILGPTMLGRPPCFNGIVAASEEEGQLLIDKTKYCFEESEFNDFIAGKVRVDKIKLINKSYTKAHTCSHKCCTPNTIIQLSDGSVKKFKDFTKDSIITLESDNFIEKDNCVSLITEIENVLK